MCYLVEVQLLYGMYKFTRKIQYNQSWSSQAVGIGSYGNRTPHTNTHAAQLHSSLSQKHNTFCEGLNGSVLKSFHFGAYESELVMAAEWACGDSGRGHLVLPEDAPSRAPLPAGSAGCSVARKQKTRPQTLTSILRHMLLLSCL